MTGQGEGAWRHGLAERRARFLRAMVARGVIAFGDFTLKSGRTSPYLLNLGGVADAAGLDILGSVFAAEVLALPTAPDVLFGPAYKGIPIAVSTALALAREANTSVGVAYNRKEAKQHGEGGSLVGAPMAGKNVVVVDDVVTDGAVKRQAVQAVAAAGGKVVAMVLAFDRQEPASLAGAGPTAVEELERGLEMPVRCVANIEDLLAYLDTEGQLAEQRERLREHLRQLRG